MATKFVMTPAAQAVIDSLTAARAEIKNAGELPDWEAQRSAWRKATDEYHRLVRGEVGGLPFWESRGRPEGTHPLRHLPGEEPRVCDDAGRIFVLLVRGQGQNLEGLYWPTGEVLEGAGPLVPTVALQFLQCDVLSDDAFASGSIVQLWGDADERREALAAISDD